MINKDALLAIKEKVAKLLALSQSNNENEAAIALTRAQKIILEYKLSVAECLACGNTFTDEQMIKDGIPLVAAKKVALWQSNICQVLALHNDCKILNYHGIGLVIFGRDSDIQNVRAMLNYTIQQLWNIAPKKMGRVYSDSWYLGAIYTIGKRLDEMRKVALKDTTITSFGLIKLEEQSKKVDTFINKTVGNVIPGKESSTSIDNHAWYRGMKDGKNINLHNGNTLS